jgi:hypothetical protein
MAQALGELRGPVTHEALRLRMAALHGREDALLDPARFPRLLRQANDAEIADVRKVGDDDYEITARRTAGMPSPTASVPAASSAAGAPSAVDPGTAAETGEPVADTSSGSRDNGQRFGVRFRRGSRGGLRAGEIPLVGVVQVDAPAEASPVEAVAVETAGPPAEETGRKSARPRRTPRKKPAPSRSEGKAAAATAAKSDQAAKGEAAEDDPGAATVVPVKRGRSRARKKAE